MVINCYIYRCTVEYAHSTGGLLTTPYYEFDEYRHPTPNPNATTPGISYVKFFSLNLD